MTTTVMRTAERGARDAPVVNVSGVSAAALLRLCGAGLVLGGILAVFGQLVLHPPGHAIAFQQTPNWATAHVLSMASFLLGAGGIIGLYVRVKDRVGVLGLVATVLLFFGFSLHAMRMADEAWVIPFIALNNSANLTAPGGPLDQAPFLGLASSVRGVVYSLGLLGFSAALLWSGFARAGAAVVLVGSVVTVSWVYLVGAGGPVSGIGLAVLQLGLGWMGYRLWRDPGAVGADTSRSRPA